MKTWLILDTNQLCHRVFHTTLGGLRQDTTPTGVMYGVFGDILRLQGQFNTSNIVFAFDYGRSIRRKQCPTYKMGRQRMRKEFPEEQLRKYLELCQQIDWLRTKYLPQIGFKNVFSQKGYEADDIIASICHNLKRGERGIIVSSDKDLLQLLSSRVSIWLPSKKQVYSRENFKNEYGINPQMWCHVKALAGCGTDEIPGIRGVGEKTAIQYLLDTLNPTSKKYQYIDCEESRKIWRRNLPIVRLPIAGTKQFKLRKDKRLEWGPALKELGIKTLNPDIVYKERP